MPSCSTERACEKQAGEDHPPVFLWAFASGGWFLFLSPTGSLFPSSFSFLCLRRVSFSHNVFCLRRHTFCQQQQKVTRRRKKGNCRWEKWAVGDKMKKPSTAEKSFPHVPPTQKGTCHGTFLFAGHFFGSVVIRLLPCFSFAPQGRGCCWVMQWILPPPKATSRVCTPTTSRSGNISCT